MECFVYASIYIYKYLKSEVYKLVLNSNPKWKFELWKIKDLEESNFKLLMCSVVFEKLDCPTIRL